MRSEQPRERKHEKGAILAFTGIVLLTLVGMTVVGVDLGRLAFTASEVQTVAEVAATGYANAWLADLPSGGECQEGTNSPYAARTLEVVSGNSIDGDPADAANIEAYECGHYNFDSGRPRFTRGGEPANAVRATATATVTNFFASLFGNSETTVQKMAVATLTCGDRARTLPLAIGDCQFDAFEGPEDCADLPTLTQQNVHVDDSCWTSLHPSDPANTNTIRGYIETICGTNNTPPPPVQKGQEILVSEGQKTPLCQAVRACYNAGIREFTVPVVRCEAASTVCAAQHSGSLTVVGFARIELADPGPNCSGNPKFIPLHAFCATDPTEGVGGSCDFGLFKVVMAD